MRKFLKTELFTSKGAIGLETIPPTPEKTDKGYTLWKPGTVLLYAAAASGERQYDWKNKVTLALNSLEIAQLLGLGSPNLPPLKSWNREGKEQLSFFHDTGKGGANEGKSTKTLNVQVADSKMLAGTKAYGFFFTQRKEGQESKVNVFLNFIQFASLQKDLELAYQSVKVVEQ